MSLRDITGDSMLSLKKFDDWIGKSRRGDRIMYYRGLIMAPEAQKLSPTNDKTRVWKLRNHVRGAYYKELVTLVQMKHDKMDYEYWAQRL
tara:strand:- start:2447 stop:2716 length:270 start_codon:yes stop_codon:yes gene_type:complete